MGRLPALAVASALFAFACDKSENKAPTATSERSQAISAPATTAAPVVSTPQPSATVATKKPPRKLCAGELDKPGKAFPDKPIGRANAPGSAEMPAKFKLGGGWTWVNFWAAWCVPCKEEMPRLKAWEKKLKDSGKNLNLVFVSLDDDKRQLEDFLKAGTAGTVTSTYWLEEGKQRETWLEAAGIEDDPELPTHLLVDASGKVRCRVKGAVEDSDFDSVAEIVSH